MRIQFLPAKRIIPDELQCEINHFWHAEIKRTSKNSCLFNGPLCRLDGWKYDENNLTLFLGVTDYKELLHSNRFTQEIINRFDAKHLSAALGISAVLISDDDQIVLIKRSESVGEYPGKLDVVGGHIHPVEHAVSGVPDPFFALKDEIQEELNLTITEPEAIACIGLAETKITRKPELIFRVYSQLTSGEIRQSGTDLSSFEISEILSVENKKQSLTNFLYKKLDQFSPSAVGSLWIYLQNIN